METVFRRHNTLLRFPVCLSLLSIDSAPSRPLTLGAF
jgi:hypothetical protein